MKILQVNTVCGQSSTGKICTDIALQLKHQGDACQILFGIGKVPEVYQKFALNTNSTLSIRLSSLRRKCCDAEGLSNFFATQRAIEKIKAFAPDIIHLHNIHGCYLNYPLFFKFLKRYQKPVVWTLHDCWPFTGHCAYFDYAHCNKWQTLCHHCPQSKLGYPPNLWLDKSKRNFNLKKHYFTSLPITFVTPSLWLKNLLKQSFLGQNACEVIYNGIDLNTFKPTMPKQSSPPLALAVANDWDERKGLNYIYALSEKLKGKVQFAVIGLSKAQVETAPSHVLALTRTQNREELAQWYSRASVFVNPTLEDNMPLVNLESLACGTPVVVFNTGGCPEVINDSVGKVVPKGDEQALLHAVVQVAQQSHHYTSECVNQAQHFGQETLHNYLKLYEHLTHKSKP